MTSRLRFAWPFLVAAVLANGCSNGCSNPFAPLPAPLPPSQTVEGGVQVRITPKGLGVISSAALDIVNGAVANGVCIPEQSKDLGIATVYACYQNQCGNNGPACL